MFVILPYLRQRRNNMGPEGQDNQMALLANQMDAHPSLSANILARAQTRHAEILAN
jgi:hypothetical protein